MATKATLHAAAQNLRSKEFSLPNKMDIKILIAEAVKAMMDARDVAKKIQAG